jgi:hypothetical protein
VDWLIFLEIDQTVPVELLGTVLVELEKWTHGYVNFFGPNSAC